MNWMKKLNQVIEYIEEHLEEPIDYEDLSNICFVSYYHFSRIFSVLTSMSVQEYIRKRRLSRSVADIISHQTILDVAIKYQYQSHEAFTKAFKRFHGSTPKQIKEGQQSAIHFPPLSFQIIVKGDTMLPYKIVNMPEQHFVGKILPQISKDTFHDEVHTLWQDALGNGGYQTLQKYSNNGLYGSLVYDINPQQECSSYLVGVPASEFLTVESYQTITIPPARFVEFELDSQKEEDVNRLKQYIFTDWILQNDFEFIPLAEVEYYEKDTNNYRFLISVRETTS